ncbi:MAG: PAS domain-containing protein [Planctomycetes bacterium]|nr:PAS domain-containing protein [Planctomycetota bacterium]
MSQLWSQFRRFWLAEEIPRWIGLPLVALFVAGPLAVAFLSIWESDKARVADHRRVCQQAASLLADTVSTETEPSKIARRLRAFGQTFSCQQLRVVDADGIVTSAISQDEVGQSNPLDSGMGTHPPTELEARALALDGTDDWGAWLIRVPIHGLEYSRRAGMPPATEAGTSNSYLELVIGGISTTPFWYRGSLWALVVILVSVTVLLLLYRRLRSHLRAVTRIGENLVNRSQELETDLAALRLSDSMGTVATAWNQLIDLTAQFQASAVRSEASSELKRVLEKTGGGELADALNAVPDGVIVLTSDRQVSFVNTMGAGLLGCQADQAVGANLAELGSTTIGEKISAVACSAGGERGFAALTERVDDETDGSSYRVSVLPMEGVRRTGSCVLLVRDISQQLRADRAREEFVSQVTHELRTPLTNIRAYAETLSSGMLDDPKVITECYNVITKETRRLGRLIEDILNVSQLEAGSMQLLIDDVDVLALVGDAVGDLRGLAEEKGIDLQLALPVKLPPFRGDRDKLTVVINNLVGNALKYTGQGGEVCVGCQSNDDQLLLTVKDNGIGIDPSDQERIFEKFQRGSDPEALQQTGTGIGLTTAREIVARHGGRVEVMSAKGEGATFVVTLPLSGANSMATSDRSI